MLATVQWSHLHTVYTPVSLSFLVSINAIELLSLFWSRISAFDVLTFPI